MPSLTIKGIPEALYRRLKKSAAVHRRSINSEVLFCLERSLHPRRIDPERFLARADAQRVRLKGPRLTDALLRELKRAGRP